MSDEKCFLTHRMHILRLRKARTLIMLKDILVWKRFDVIQAASCGLTLIVFFFFLRVYTNVCTQQFWHVWEHVKYFWDVYFKTSFSASENCIPDTMYFCDNSFLKYISSTYRDTSLHQMCMGLGFYEKKSPRRCNGKALDKNFPLHLDEILIWSRVTEHATTSRDVADTTMWYHNVTWLQSHNPVSWRQPRDKTTWSRDVEWRHLSVRHVLFKCILASVF